MFKNQYPNAVHKFAKLAETRHETLSLARAIPHIPISLTGGNEEQNSNLNESLGSGQARCFMTVLTAIKNAITTVIKTAVYFH